MNTLSQVIMSHSHSIQEMTWLQKGKSVHLDAESGTLKLTGLKNKICRIFIPKYAEKENLAVAQYLITKLEKISSGTNSITITKPDALEQFKAAEAFISKRLKSYNSEGTEIVVCKKNLQRFLNTAKVSNKLNVSYDVLKANPEFVKFAIANHLHNRIDKTYQERNLAVSVIENKIYLKARYTDPRTGEYTNAGHNIEWTKLPTDSKNKIIGWELMAYGWQPHEKTKVVILEPVKIITLKEGQKPEYAIELVTAKPTYNLANLGLGTFGHSWLRVYEPCLDSSGKPTNQVAVYSVGYNLESLVSPDIFEFIERENITTRESITRDQFLRLKKNTEAIMQVTNSDKKQEGISKNATSAVEHWVLSNCITCGTFAARMFEDTTGKHINGRFLVMKALIPDSWRLKVANLTSQLPIFKGVLKKITLFTHGYFPGIMIKDQTKFAAAALNAKFGNFHIGI